MSILIADDEKRDRTWLADLLGRELSGNGPIYEACDGEEAVASAKKHKPDLIFLDIKMPKLSGIKAAEQILQARPETGIIILSNFSDEVYVRQLWKIVPADGAFGYLLKNASDNQVIEAATTVLSGDCWIHPGIARVIQRTQNRATNLTSAEYEALVLIALGFTDHAIAKKLYLTEKAVQSRLKSLYTKLAIPSRTEGLDTEFNQRCRAVHTATKRGLINQSELEEWEAKLLAAQKTIGVLLTGLALAATIFAAPGAFAQQTMAGASLEKPARLSGHIQLSRVSPATAGVRLLEDIFSRIRSMSQVALSAGNLKYDAKMNRPGNAAGQADPLLAIKPKQSPSAEPPGIESALGTTQATRAEATADQVSTSHIISYSPRVSNVHIYTAPREIQILDERPVVHDFAQPLSTGIKAPAASPSHSAMQKSPVIASLPPDVATGIPFVQLGTTQEAVGKTIARQGNISCETIGSWTVWSLHKPKASKDFQKNTTMQIFMHEGQVEALRIFDSSLVKSDLGVKLGDNLRSVKERFGEPSMILPEESPGAGQNYIYPMNQIGFLLARPAPGAEPQVVSLLIFKVK